MLPKRIQHEPHKASLAIHVSPLLFEAAGSELETVLQKLHTPKGGLSREEAEQRLHDYGPNVVAREERHPRVHLLGKALVNSLVILSPGTWWNSRPGDMIPAERGEFQRPPRFRFRKGRTRLHRGYGRRVMGYAPENFPCLQTLLPRLDWAVHALITDLHGRGLSQDVLVYVGGEMGRTPKVGQSTGNGAGTDGRDHWTRAGFGLYSGGGLNMGRVIGHTASASVGIPYTPQNMLATL